MIWQAAANEMNPTLSAHYLASTAESDPLAYRSEVLGEFRQGPSSLFDTEALDGVVVPYREQLFTPGHEYAAFCDPSGGRGDAFTLATGHHRDGRVIVDRLRAWRPPFNPSDVVAEAANLVKSYQLAALTGDRSSGEWVAEAFRANGLDHKSCETPKSDLYLSLLAAVNSRALDVPDVPDLLRELRGLERRRGNSGRDRGDHAPGAGQHDDLANSLAGLAHLLIGDEATELHFLCMDRASTPEPPHQREPSFWQRRAWKDRLDRGETVEELSNVEAQVLRHGRWFPHD